MLQAMSLGNRYKVKLNNTTEEWEYYDNEILIPNKKEILYKYLSFNENTIASLMGCYFWMTNPVSFNDPFDCNKNLIVDYAENPSEIKWDTRNHFKNIGITSFTEEKCHPLMWAHYTNNYNGLIIEFDTKIENFLTEKDEIKNLRWRKVIYPTRTIPLQQKLPFAEEIMLTAKLPFWEYENEWRLIGDLTNDHNRYVHFNPSQIKRFYLGYNLVKNNPCAFQILINIRDKNYPHADIWWVRPSSTKYGSYEIRKFNIDEIGKIIF